MFDWIRAEVIRNYEKCLAKLYEENKMKHPCGKVFIINKLSRTRGCKDQLRIVNTGSENLRACGFALAAQHNDAGSLWRYYLPCGHYFATHEDNDLDLVNVPEKDEQQNENKSIKIDLYDIQRQLKVVELEVLKSDGYSESNEMRLIRSLWRITNEIVKELEKLNA